jgi:hypothetical protein
MHITSHGYWTGRLARRARTAHPALTALGGTLPDLPAAALTVSLRVAGRPWRRAGDEAFAPRFELVHRATHALAGPAVLALASPRRSRRRALATGWAGHILVDLVSHHTDARPPWWPLSSRLWRSPVSHWERDRHAAVWNAADLIALLAAARRETRVHGRFAAATAAVVSALGLWEAVAGGRSCRADGARSLERTTKAACG